MLEITLKGDEYWDEDAERFFYPEAKTLQLEHSLVALSKWEAKFHKLFLSSEEKTEEEMLGYIEAMIVTPGVSAKDLQRLSVEDLAKIDAYINDPMTGTTFSNSGPPKRTSELISSELVYYWMSQFNISKEHENWHLNRLFTLIRVHHVKSEKPKKVSAKTQAAQMAEINAKRKAQMGTKG